MSGRLEGKVAIVTGAGSGLGEATARMYAAQGAKVMCADIDEAGVTRTVADIVAAGGSAVARRVDVTSSAACKEMTDATVDAFGRVDVVFACAGIAGAGDAATTTEEDWDRVIAINLTSKWLTFKHALPLMVAQGSGSVIVQASIGGMIGVPNIFPYAAAKGGCIGMVKQAAADFGPHGVRVNAIAPGTIVTPLVRESYAKGGGMSAGLGVEEGIRRAHERYPLRRLGTLEEFAYLATYVASDESGWTTGHTFVIDGGVTIV
jgi:NAD(P)-dependent dehydrogenase (short-subunit alcohol dehydrogenase family)